MRLALPFALVASTCLLQLVLPPTASAIDLERADVRGFIDEVVARHSLDAAWVAKLVADARSQSSIIDAMNRPAERVRPWYDYRDRFITPDRIGSGVAFWQLHRAVLEEIAVRRGVPPEVILAIIGVETSYGRITGKFRVIDALATLAFDYPPRASYFRGELEQFLLLARETGIDPLTATGSYAGAMGAAQFMPRSYRNFAVDGDADGKVDLWNDWADVFESIANYLREHGWRPGEAIVSRASLYWPEEESLDGFGLSLNETVDSLERKGVLFQAALPPDAPAKFVALAGRTGPEYRVAYNNFHVITRYNRSNLYALAVTELAEALRTAAPVESPPAVAAGAEAEARP